MPPAPCQPLDDLSALRDQIDQMDDQIHDLLMRRIALVAQVAAIKGSSALIRPKREIEIIARLLQRHQGALPFVAVARIWREIIGAMTWIEGGLSGVMVQAAGLDRTARDHFGVIVPLSDVASPTEALALCRQHPARVAIMPWPHAGDDGWWQNLADPAAHGLQIIAKLPLLADDTAMPAALVAWCDTMPEKPARRLVVGDTAAAALLQQAGDRAHCLAFTQNSHLIDMAADLYHPSLAVTAIGSYTPPLQAPLRQQEAS